jgi:competence protein ComEA
VPRFGAPAPGVDPAAVTGAGPDGSTGDNAAAPSPASPVDLNTATAQQLDALPGIGPATAAAIIADRQANGPFRSVDDLGRVRGIGDAKLEQLRGLVTV